MQTLRQKYLDACLGGDTDTIIHMIKTEDLNFRNKNFLIQCLKHASKGHNIDICKIILGHRNILEKFDYVELYIIVSDACRNGDLNIFKFYLSQTACCKINSVSSVNFFREACKSGNIELVKYILDSSKNLLKSLCDRGGDFLHSACISGNVEIVNFIITHAKCNWNWGLYEACGANGDHIEIVELMIKKGAISFDGCFEGACLAGNKKIIDLLIERKVTRNEWDEGMCHASRGGCMDVVVYMVLKGATNWNGGMMHACDGGHLDIVKFMILQGANDWNTSLFWASRKGHLEIVKFMLLQGATNFDDCLNCACLCGDIDFVKTVVEKGATNWDEGLIQACKGGHVILVKLMLHHGATNLNEGLKNTSNKDICIFLINNGADDLNCLTNIHDFRLSYMYHKFKGYCNNYMDLLSEYPPYVLFVGSKLSKNNCVKRLPVELFRTLVQYC